MMTPEHRLAAVLFGSAVLCLPALSAMVADELEPSAVGVRYGASVALVWVAIRLVERMLQGYVDHDLSRVAVDAEQAETPTHDRRRATDAGDDGPAVNKDEDTQPG